MEIDKAYVGQVRENTGASLLAQLGLALAPIVIEPAAEEIVLEWTALSLMAVQGYEAAKSAWEAEEAEKKRQVRIDATRTERREQLKTSEREGLCFRQYHERKKEAVKRVPKKLGMKRSDDLLHMEQLQSEGGLSCKQQHERKR
jgi:hypothetical protein